MAVVQLTLSMDSAPIVDEVQVAVGRYLMRMGRSSAYRRDQVRRVATLQGFGFPWQQFWRAASRLQAEEIALDWLQGMQDAGKPDTALDNYSKLLNLCGRVLELDGFHLASRARYQPRRLAFSTQEIRQVLDDYRHPEPAIYARNRCLFVVACLVGERRGELSRMDLADLDRDRGRVFVKSSKKGPRTWEPVHEDLWPFVQAWLDVRPDPGSQALFCTIRGEPRRLAPRGVYTALRSMGKGLGLTINANATRHTRGKRITQAKMSDPARQFLMRHGDRRNLFVYEEFDYRDAEIEARGKDPGLYDEPGVAEACPTCGRPF